MRLKQYEVYSAATARVQIYENMPDDESLDESEQSQTKDIERDMLLDVVWAKNEDEAVKSVALEEDVDPGTLYAAQHVVDTCLLSDDPGRKVKLEASGYVAAGNYGIDIDLPNQFTLRVSFSEDNSAKLLLFNPDEGSIEELFETDSLF